MPTLTRRAALLAPIPLLLSGRVVVAQTAPASDVAASSNYLSNVLRVGSLSTRHSELALKRGTDPLVRSFAQMEIDEQQAITSVLAATGADRKSPLLLPAQQNVLDQLAAMENGEAFDLSYVENQIAVHDELLAVHLTMAGEREPSVSAITARLSQQVVASHIATLNLIQQLMGARHIQQVDEMQDQPVPAIEEQETQ